MSTRSCGGRPRESIRTAGTLAATLAAPPSHASSELVLYSMMALVNLSYCNERVQQLVKSCGGIPLIQAQLSSPLYEARKTAAFCLGNLVRDSASNAAELGLNGGVEALLRCLNDEDDDELSKTAYGAIQHLDDVGLEQLLKVVRECTHLLLEAKGGAGRGPRPAGGGGGRAAPAQRVLPSPHERARSGAPVCVRAVGVGAVCVCCARVLCVCCVCCV